MSGPTFFGRFFGSRFFGRPFWGPMATVATVPLGHDGLARRAAGERALRAAELRRRRRLIRTFLLALAIDEAAE